MKYIILVFVFAFLLVGCATTRHKVSYTKELEERISNLEEELKIRDEQINQLENELSKRQLSKTYHPITTKNIQKALYNAGFYKGKIDGVMGEKTKEAIKEFQKANGLKVDGVVGKKTWERLSKYLD